MDNKNVDDDDCTKWQLGDNSIFMITVCPSVFERKCFQKSKNNTSRK